jgi:murein DD-endopeptidase MepM/ murein hydrolase activator NlpD
MKRLPSIGPTFRLACLLVIVTTSIGLSLAPAAADARQRPRPPIGGGSTPQRASGDQRPDIPFTRPRPAIDQTAIRLWPMVAGSYWFCQGFGCVPQLGFYQVVPGCPPEAPAFHTGLDLAAPYGTVIYAAASGTILSAGPDRPTEPANSLIVIQHEGANAGYATQYMHWSISYVVPGQYVVAGQPIAEVGSVGYSTGAHLHFGVINLASAANIDPLTWLPWDPTIGP